MIKDIRNAPVMPQRRAPHVLPQNDGVRTYLRMHADLQLMHPRWPDFHYACNRYRR